MTDLPQPLTPADCNLRGMHFMPLMVTQVLQSETFALSTGDEFKAAFALWSASWLEVPAASLPNDDRMLEYLSKSKIWKRVKTMALRGWVLCADGRLYHHVIAERALEAWEKRTDYREKEESKNTRQQRWREQCKLLSEQLRAAGVTPPKGASLETLKRLLTESRVDVSTSTNVDAQTSTVDAGEMPKRETVKRERQLTSKAVNDDASVPDHAGGLTAAPLPTREAPPISNDPAIQLSVALRRQGVNVTFTHPAVQDWASKGVTIEMLTEAVATARMSKGDGAKIPANYLVPIIAELLNPPAAATPTANGKPRSDDWAWKRSNQGIEAKGREVGLFARGGESYGDFASRIQQAIDKRKGQP